MTPTPTCCLPRSLASRGGLGDAQPVGVGAGFKDVRVERDSINYCGHQSRIWEHRSPFAKRQVTCQSDTCAFLPLGDDLKQQFGSARVDLDIPELIEAKQIQAPVPGHHPRQDAFVGGFDEFVDQLCCGDVADPVAFFARSQPQTYKQVSFSGAGSEGDRLQQLRAVLPCDVRVVAETHPLFGRLLAARSFKRWNGVLLVVELRDGSPGTIRADATDVLGVGGVGGAGAVLDAAGLRELHRLTQRLFQSRVAGFVDEGGVGSPRP